MGDFNDNRIMKTLHLNLHRKWFDMIKSGEKTEEYREITPYWMNRLTEVKDGKRVYKEFKSVTFSNGYRKDRDQVVVEFKFTSRGTGNTQWGAEPGKKYFIIHVGEEINQASLLICYILKEYKRLGFDSPVQWSEMVANVDLSSMDKIQKFMNWRDLDGTYEGLLALPKRKD